MNAYQAAQLAYCQHLHKFEKGQCPYLFPVQIYERVAFVSNITKDLDPGNAANCRDSFDYVASSPTAARAAMEIFSQNEEMLSKLGYAYELN